MSLDDQGVREGGRLAGRLAAAFAMLVLPTIAAAADRLTAAEAQEVIGRLSDASFEERGKAAARLTGGGPDAVDVVATATGSADPEVAVRAMDLLGEMWVAAHGRDDWETVERVVDALQRLREERSRSAVFAEAVFRRHEALEDDRMIAAVRDLGAEVAFVGEGDDPLSRFTIPMPTTRRQTQTRPALKYIYLGPKWRGGEKGLGYIRRLPLQRATLFFTPGENLTAAMLEELTRDHPQLQIQKRGKTKLGIKAEPTAERCEIDEITPESAADLAGLQRGDIIIRFGDEAVSSLGDLVEAIEPYDPGDEVTVTFFRAGEEMSVTVTMKPWQGE
ncbi:MAG: PDZ domain-containing protein [Planctomycetota bacterium]